MFDPARLTADTIAAIKAHAVACHPAEMCGVITPDHGFMPLLNRHPNPNSHFDCSIECAALQATGQVIAVIHSHPDGPEAPSGDDVAGQLHMAMPWGILLCTGEGATDPYWWGDQLEPPPLEGRSFRHGPSGTDGKGDCGALIRDWYRLERGVLIPDFPREDGWWRQGKSLYEDHFAAAGFSAVPMEAAEPGDVALFTFRSPVANHGGIYLGRGIILHHLSGRTSRQESVLGWMKMLTRVLRHAG
ncbi:MAG: Mov34/MPN/PAD-1 family protein [Janthinobacterium lividum]